MDDELGGHGWPGCVPRPQDQVHRDGGADDADRTLVAVCSEQICVLTDRVDARGGPGNGQIDDELAHAVAGWLMADAGPPGGLCPTLVQRLGVETREGSSDPVAQLRDGEALGGGQYPRLDRGGDLRLGRAEQVEQRAHLADVDTARVERAPGAPELRCQQDRLDRQRLGFPLRTAADHRQLGHERLRDVGEHRGLPEAGVEPGTAQRDRSLGRARCCGVGPGRRWRRRARRRSGTRVRRRPRCRRRVRDR